MKKSFKLFTLAFALLFAVVVKVNAEACTEDCVEIGTTKYDTLEEAIASAKSGDTIKLLGDIENVSDIIYVNREGTLTIDGDGHSVTGTAKKIFEVSAVDGNDEGTDKFFDITFKNISISTNFGGGRAINTRTGDIKLTVENSTLTNTNTTSNNQTLLIGGAGTNIEVLVKDSTIVGNDSGYGIISFLPVKLTVDNSNVSGYAAIYMKEGTEGSEITIKNKTVLTGKNDHTGDTNNFGTVALEDDGIEISIIDSKVEATGTGGAKQVIISQGDNLTVEKDTTITVSGKSELVARPEGFVVNQGISKVIIEAGVSSNIEVPTEFLPEDVELVENEDGSFSIVEKEEEKEPAKDEGKEEIKNPNTGDNLIVFIMMAILGLGVTIFTANKLRKNA